MRKIGNFGDGTESLWQQAKEGEYTKLFSVVDNASGEVVIADLIPTTKTWDEAVPILELKDLEQITDWHEKTGLVYLPKGFLRLQDASDDHKAAFDFQQVHSPEVTADIKPEQPQEKLNSIEPLNLEEDLKRGYEEEKPFSKVVLELCHKRGQKVYDLARLDQQQETLKEEFNSKMEAIESKKRVALETIDTFDLCLEALLKTKE